MADWSKDKSPGYHANGDVQVTPKGVWYVRRDGKWVKMTPEEIEERKAFEERKASEVGK